MKFIKKFLFHRITFIFIAMMAQFFVLVSVLIRFYDYFALFYAVSILISILAVISIISNFINPAYKLAWIIPIMLFPVFGGVFYLLFAGNRVGKKTKLKMNAIEQKSKKVLPANKDVLLGLENYNKIAANQSRYIQDYALFPIYANSMTEYLPNGEKKFERLKDELKKAKKYIFLEYFIIEQGFMWDTLLDILVKKVAEGVDVRLIYDDAGCMFTLPYKYNKRLEKLGIKCCVFNPLSPILSSRYNNRDHRKLTIIDGCTGFTGGINLADEYINRFEKYGHWKDSAIMIKGEAVWSMTVMFLSMWNYLNPSDEELGKFKQDYCLLADEVEGALGYVQPFADSPLSNETVGEVIYLNLINKAKDYVYITTPYLVIDNEMIIALTSAAKSGVDVRIITPHRPDRWYVHAVSRSYYKTLVESGVKIYEYVPGFIHSKVFVSDDEYGVVSTINMDYRSLYLHFECGVWTYKSVSVGQMKSDFLETLNVCKQITNEDFKNVKWYKLFVSSILRVFAPLM